MVFDEFKSIYLAIMVSSNFVDINHEINSILHIRPIYDHPPVSLCY